MEFERRFLTRKLEVRAEGEQQPRRIVGYAAVFNSLSENLGGFRELILPGAFTETLEDDVKALLNHDPNKLLGRTLAGTLLLQEDDIGLRYEIIPPDTQYARDLLVSIERGDLDQSSFQFIAGEESWRHPTDEEPLPIRVLHQVRLFDVSPVVFPAYPTTSAGVRDMAKQMAHRPAERDAGSGQAAGRDAKAIAVGRRDLMRRKIQLLKLRRS
jgi:HK97 family phage prohead protease